MIRYAENKHIPALMEMWRLCFPDDTEEFITFYFNSVYRNDETLIFLEAGIPVASMQVIPYQMKIGRKIYEAAYISGAMTHPEFRRRGYMEQLIHFAFSEMQKKGIPISFLIPQEEWLFDFYAKFGYQKAFPIQSPQTIFHLEEAEKYIDDPAIRMYTGYDEAGADILYLIYIRFLEQKENVVLKSRLQLSNILKDLFIDQGMVFASDKGIAFAIPDEDNKDVVHIREFFCMDGLAGLFLNTIAQRLSKKEIIISNSPWESLCHFGGMIKKIDESIVLPEDIYMNAMLN